MERQRTQVIQLLMQMFGDQAQPVGADYRDLAGQSYAILLEHPV